MSSSPRSRTPSIFSPAATPTDSLVLASKDPHCAVVLTPERGGSAAGGREDREGDDDGAVVGAGPGALADVERDDRKVVDEDVVEPDRWEVAEPVRPRRRERVAHRFVHLV